MHTWERAWIVGTIGIFGLIACGESHGSDALTADAGTDGGNTDVTLDVDPIDAAPAVDVAPDVVVPDPTELQWEPCAVPNVRAAVDCAWTPRPARRGVEGSKTLYIGVLRALSGEVGAPQIWMLNGGPGGPGSSLAVAADYLRQAGIVADVYMLDHRGVGNSEFLDCPMTGGSQAQIAELCSIRLREQWGDDLDGFTTSESTRDLGELIDELRVPGVPVVVYGNSYGSYWAHRYLQIFPDQADAVLTDGNCISGLCSFHNVDLDREEVVRRVLDKCDADAACSAEISKRHENAEAMYMAVYNRIQAGDGCSWLTNEPALQTALQVPHYFNASHLIAPILSRAARCNADDQMFLSSYADALRRFGGGGGFENTSRELDGNDLIASLPRIGDGDKRLGEQGTSNALYLQIVSGELWPSPGPSYQELVDLWGDRLPGMDGGARFRLQQTVNAWGAKYERDEFIGSYYTPGATPWYMVHGEFDLQTGLTDAQTAADQFGHILHVEPGGGHGVVLSHACGLGIIGQVLANPSQEPDTSCLADEWGGFFEAPSFASFIFGTTDLWGEDETPVAP